MKKLEDKSQNLGSTFSLLCRAETGISDENTKVLGSIKIQAVKILTLLGDLFSNKPSYNPKFSTRMALNLEFKLDLEFVIH